MKKAIMAVILMGALTLCGCSTNSFVRVMSKKTNLPTTKSSSYQLFSGNENYDFKVKDGETLTIAVSVVTEEGTLGASIAKDGDDEKFIYQGTDIPTSDFTVSIEEKGAYTIRVDAEKHKGSYSFKW